LWSTFKLSFPGCLDSRNPMLACNGMFSLFASSALCSSFKVMNKSLYICSLMDHGNFCRWARVGGRLYKGTIIAYKPALAGGGRSCHCIVEGENFNTRYWSWSYRRCWRQTCPPIDFRKGFLKFYTFQLQDMDDMDAP
jgi:hypothetical protein